MIWPILAADARPEPPPAPVVTAAAVDPVDGAVAFVLEALRGRMPSEADVAKRFSPDFVAQVPAADLLPVFTQLRGAWTVGTVSRRTADTTVLQLVLGEDRLQMTLAVDGQGRISALIFAPAVAEPAPTWDGFAARLEAVAAAVSIGVYALADGTCTPVFERNADVARPLGSAFKLYVLGTLARQVGADAVAWTEPLVVTDAAKSLPSGVLQDRPVGSTVTVREAAEGMIAISDNTATDMLIGRLGVPAIEAALPTLGMADPGRSTPWLTTRQLFVLKWGLGGEQVAAYQALDVAGRRAMLAARVDGQPLPRAHAVAPGVPVAPEGVEWFASPHDLCRLWGAMLAGPEVPTVRALVSKNPGVPFQGWSFVGFKGGSEPGVLAGSWLLESAGGRRYVASMALADPHRPIPDTVAFEILTADRLLAR